MRVGSKGADTSQPKFRNEVPLIFTNPHTARFPSLGFSGDTPLQDPDTKRDKNAIVWGLGASRNPYTLQSPQTLKPPLYALYSTPTSHSTSIVSRLAPTFFPDLSEDTGP